MGEHPGSGPVMNITTACDSWPTPAEELLAIILGLFDKFAEVF